MLRYTFNINDICVLEEKCLASRQSQPRKNRSTDWQVVAIRTLSIRLSIPYLGQTYCITPITLSQTETRDGTCPWIPPKGLTTFMIPPSLPPPAGAFWTLFSQDPVMKQLYAWFGDALGRHLLKHCSRPSDQQAGLRSQPSSSRQSTIASSPLLFFSFSKYLFQTHHVSESVVGAI